MNEQWEQVARVQKVEMRWNQPNGEPMNENFILLQIFAAGQKEGRKE
jgi:hypothetical protein